MPETRYNRVFTELLPLKNVNFYEADHTKQKVAHILEEHFDVQKKVYMIPLIGRIFPVYTYYKLKRN